MGSTCNLDCDYCFYLEKSALYPARRQFPMSDEVLKRFIESYVRSQPGQDVEFVWHGGEPTMAGIDFYRRVIRYQKPFLHEKTIRNSIQTNGTLLDDEWCAFLAENRFFVGLSLDGPPEIHNRYRHERGGKPSFFKVYGGLKLLQKYKVDFNVLAAVGRETAYKPADVYRFFKDEGIEYVQFTPIVERMPDKKSRDAGLLLAGPLSPEEGVSLTSVTPWSVEPERYGDFLIAVFDEWVRKDVGRTFVMNFEWTMSAALDGFSPVCIFSRQCGRAVVVEHDGAVYACDHHVYPDFLLGNILDSDLAPMVELSISRGFGPHKERSLPSWCRECDVVRACWGGCPKQRFLTTPAGESGLNYLCAGYSKFYHHVAKYMTAFRRLEELNLDPSLIMESIDQPLIIEAGENTGGKEVFFWIR